MRELSGARFAATNASMSGCSHDITPIIAPRRGPISVTVAHICSHSCMNDTGPDERPPVASVFAPFGRNGEKSVPMPPPSCIVTAASRAP